MKTKTMKPWRRSFRECWCPVLSGAELRALLEALECDDARLIHGQTAKPVGWTLELGKPCVQACAIGAAIWLAHGPGLTAGQVMRAWEDRVHAAAMHGRGIYSEPWHFYAWWDRVGGASEDQRRRVYRLVAREIRRELAIRCGEQVA